MQLLRPKTEQFLMKPYCQPLWEFCTSEYLCEESKQRPQYQKE